MKRSKPAVSKETEALVNSMERIATALEKIEKRQAKYDSVILNILEEIPLSGFSKTQDKVLRAAYSAFTKKD